MTIKIVALQYNNNNNMWNIMWNNMWNNGERMLLSINIYIVHCFNWKKEKYVKAVWQADKSRNWIS